jgi:hypothetical protein
LKQESQEETIHHFIKPFDLSPFGYTQSLPNNIYGLAIANRQYQNLFTYFCCLLIIASKIMRKQRQLLKRRPTMKHLTLSIIISVLVILFTGCSMRCFYQAGKSIEQCERDLLECAYSDRSIRSCMQDRGYQYLDANTLPQSRKRRKIVVVFQESVGSDGRKAMPEEYWIVDGRDIPSDDFKVVSEPETQKIDTNAQPGKLIGYRVKKDASGKLMKDASGNFIFVPVYEQ